jgi:hypothetical protein
MFLQSVASQISFRAEYLLVTPPIFSYFQTFPLNKYVKKKK